MSESSDAPIGPPSCSPRESRSVRKRSQVLEGAREVLLADGYEGASVDEIARTAGISKATLYRHFADKSALFAAVAEQECARQAAHYPDIDCDGRCVGEILTEVARRTIEFGLSDFGQSVVRIAVAEAGRFPDIGQRFYAAGPERGRRLLAPVLAAADASGALTVPDADFAAETFLALCRAGLVQRRLFGVGAAPTRAEIDAHVERVVALFLKAFDHRPPQATRES